jgi:hypothetical protein
MKKKLLLFAALSIVAFLLYRCTTGKKSDNNLAVEPIDTNFNIKIKPTTPPDPDTGATPKTLSEYAWEEFLALNWRASYATDGKRGMPDTTWSYQNENNAFADLDVWETFAHRTELRPYTNQMLPFDAPPHYSFGDKLTAGTSTIATSFKLFNNLDENNEIGSCDMYAHVNTYQKKYQVLYEAKVNRDEYDYIRDNYPTKEKLLAAATQTMQNIKAYKAYYPKATSSCGCPVKEGVICLPCCKDSTTTGTIEVKAAWRQLTPLDDPKNFFTRKVIVYQAGLGNKITYTNLTYALIALHIIHKTQNYPAFIFATFEHVDVERDSMGYSLITPTGESSTLTKPYRDPIRAITQASSNYVHNMLPAKSVWRNYRLVGVQAKPTSDSTSTAINFFLSNYVVESDYTLNHFNGSGIDSAHNHRNNVLYKNQLYSMGGCQGCHGATQLKQGTDFSFLLDTVDKPVRAPDVSIKTKFSKLTRYVKAFKLAGESAAKK